MKNFFKKLSFVLAVAMVLTSITPATASAASKNFIRLNGSSKAITSVTAWIGGVTRNLDYSINGKTSGVKGTWKSSNTDAVKVDAKTGVITPVANGSAYVTFTAATGEVAKVVVKARTRAAALHVYDAADYAAGNKNVLENTTIDMKVGETKELKVTMPTSKKAQAAGSNTATYYSYPEVADSAVVSVVKNSDRAYTLTAKAAGETTVTIVANQTTEKNVRANKYFKEAKFTVKVEEGFGIVDVTADKANVLTVTFASSVDTEDVTVSVSKNSNAVDAKVAWNADKTVATITTTARMTKGTYTVKAVSAADAAKKAEKSVEIENQYVAEIQILNDVALTGVKNDKDAMKAYVYYKVVDQYGEDLTSSTSIQWNTSCGDPVDKDRNIGRLTLERSDSKAFTYGEQIFVTGVYTKTGKSVQATLTVGAAQALDTLVMAGFVKKNTTEIVKTLPNGFRSGEYFLLYDGIDQNGNVLEADDYNKDEYVTFITDNVLLVKEVKFHDNIKTMVVDGHEYRAVQVEPGQYVDKGGEVNFTAIATRTGKSTKQNYVVGQNQILTSFTMSAPTEVFADGEKHVIPFVALDQNGEEIKNFTTLADNLNKLNFSVSEGTLKLSEKDDRTAVLTFSDSDKTGWGTYATDGVDRTVSLTAVVVGGGSDTLLLSISDKARPDAIYSVNVPAAMVEDYEGEVKLSNITFLDQYGRKMLNSWGLPTDNGFFAAAKAGLVGTDFTDYTYDVVMEFKGSDTALVDNYGITVDDASGKDRVLMGVYNSNAKVSYKADKKTLTSNSGNIFTFAIAKKKSTESEYENVSPTYKHTFAVVDISQVKNFAVADLNKQYVNTVHSGKLTGQIAGLNKDNVTGAAVSANVKPGYEQTISVVGYYNGNKVSIPASYVTVTGEKLKAGTVLNQYGAYEWQITNVSDSAIKWSDLYDVSTSNYLRKDTYDSLKVEINRIFSNGENGITVGYGITPALQDVVTKTVTISDGAPVLTTVITPEKMVMNPADTKINIDEYIALVDGIVYPYGVSSLEEKQNGWPTYNSIFQDQYGKSRYESVERSYRVSSVKEAAGYADNNFTVSKNAEKFAEIEGAECGDTFVLTVVAKDGDVIITKDIAVTVGADVNAWMTQLENRYTIDPNTQISGENGEGLKPILDNQRLNTLK